MGSRFCDACLAAAPKPSPPLCDICGNSLTGTPLRLPDGRKICRACAEHPPAFTAARSWAVMAGSVRKAVHLLKYRRDLALADVLAAQMLHLLVGTGWEVDGIVPVPLGKQRRKQRGYNQAALLAFPLALGIGKPYLGKALVRVRETRSQVGLNAAERRRNVAGAFLAPEPSLVEGKTLLLVDDVMTTGATLNAAAAALLAAGAREVFAVTVARALMRRLGD